MKRKTLKLKHNPGNHRVAELLECVESPERARLGQPGAILTRAERKGLKPPAPMPKYRQIYFLSTPETTSDVDKTIKPENDGAITREGLTRTSMIAKYFGIVRFQSALFSNTPQVRNTLEQMKHEIGMKNPLGQRGLKVNETRVQWMQANATIPEAIESLEEFAKKKRRNQGSHLVMGSAKVIRAYLTEFLGILDIGGTTPVPGEVFILSTCNNRPYSLRHSSATSMIFGHHEVWSEPQNFAKPPKDPRTANRWELES